MVVLLKLYIHIMLRAPPGNLMIERMRGIFRRESPLQDAIFELRIFEGFLKVFEGSREVFLRVSEWFLKGFPVYFKP